MDYALSQILFNQYVKNYDLKNVLIYEKITHSYRTATVCMDIARRLHLKTEYVELAWLMGLLHDIARFEQITRFGSMRDTTEFDHGDESVRILFQDKKIVDFGVDSSYYPFLEKAIKYHNKMVVDEGSPLEMLFCNMIRDADKIDIFYQIYNSSDFYKMSGGVTKEVCDCIRNHTMVSYPMLRTKADKCLLLCAMIFDINLPVSMEIIREKEDFANFLKKCSMEKKNKLFDESLSIIRSYFFGKE